MKCVVNNVESVNFLDIMSCVSGVPLSQVITHYSLVRREREQGQTPSALYRHATFVTCLVAKIGALLVFSFVCGTN